MIAKKILTSAPYTLRWTPPPEPPKRRTWRNTSASQWIWNSGFEAHSADLRTYLARNALGPGWRVVIDDVQTATCETREVARALLRSKQEAAMLAR